MDGFKKKLSELTARIKSVKHIEIILAVVAVAVMIIIFTGFKNKSNASDVKETTVKEVVDEQSGVTVWEKKLAGILSGIDGVGKAEVMITAKSTTEKVTANTTSTTNTASGSGVNTTTSVTTSPVIVTNNGKSEPYVIKELMPEIIGVIVVAEGADNAVTKLSIMRAVQTALNIDSSCVEIYPMK